jgi:hypothetical protein
MNARTRTEEQAVAAAVAPEPTFEADERIYGTMAYGFDLMAQAAKHGTRKGYIKALGAFDQEPLHIIRTCSFLLNVLDEKSLQGNYTERHLVTARSVLAGLMEFAAHLSEMQCEADIAAIVEAQGGAAQ